MTNRFRTLGLPIVLVLAFGLRWLYLHQHTASPYFHPWILDPGYYHTWALRLLKGQWLGAEVFFGLPLYPFFLSAVYKLSTVNVLVVKIVQALLGVVHVALLFRLTGMIFGRGAISLIAAVLAACYAPYIFHEVILIPEALSMPLYTAALILVLKLWNRPRLRTGLGAGMLIGLAGLTKAGIFLFFPVFLVYFLFRNPAPRLRRVKCALAIVAMVILCIAPVTVHNALASRDFVPLTSHAGLNFFIGNNPLATGLFKAPPGVRSNIEGQQQDSKVIAERTLGRTLKPSEVSRFWFDLGLKFIATDPGHALTLGIHKLGLFLNHQEISDVEDIRFSRRYAPSLNYLGIGFSVLWALAVPGLVFGWSHARPGIRSVWFLWVISYVGAVVAFFVVARYRLPMISAFIPFAAYGLRDLFQTLGGRHAKKCFVTAILMLVAAGITRIPLAEPDFAVQYANVGNILMKQNRLAEAVRMYEEAIATNPDYAKVYNDLGVAYKLEGQHEKAEASFREAIARNPDHALAYNNLGLLMDQIGQGNRAEFYFKKAIHLQPHLPEAFNNLGMIYGKRGDLDRAMDAFRHSLTLNPHSPRVLTNIGLILYRRGDLAGAKLYWQKALEADPRFPDARKGLEALAAQGH